MEQFLGWWNYPGAVVPRPSHPVVHPAPAADAAAQGQGQEQEPAQGQGQEAAPAAAAAAAARVENANANAPPPRVVMVDLLGAPGTRWGLCTHLAQAILAAAAIGFMASTNDFHQITAFRLLVAAATLQCLWSLALAAVDVYTLLLKRSFRTPRATTIISIGDWATGSVTCAAASASAGITILISNDMMLCSENHCPSFMAATAMAFLSWFAIAPSCLFNLMTAVYRVQRGSLWSKNRAVCVTRWHI